MHVGRPLYFYIFITRYCSLAEKKYTPPSVGTFPTDNLLFVGLLIGVIIIVGGLTFFPAFSLGSITEHILMIMR